MPRRGADCKGAVMALAAVVSITMSARDAAADLRLTTEEYPPVNFTDENGEVTGIAVDAVKAALDEAGLDYEIEIMPWNRAYRIAETNADACVFATWHTQDRDSEFEWIGPIAEDAMSLFRRSDDEIVIESIEESFAYNVGAVEGWGFTEQLQDAGHPNLYLVSADDARNVTMLERGRIDLWASGRLVAPYLAAQESVEIEEVFAAQEVDLSIACHPDTDPDHLAAFREGWAVIRDNGTLDAIRAAYR